MLPLPHGRILLVIGWLLVAFTVYGSLASHGVRMPVSISDKVQHFASYFLMMTWFSGLYARRYHWILALGLLALGGTLEVLQGVLTTTREMDLRDLAANAGGIAMGYGLGGFGLAKWALWVESWWGPKKNR